MPTVNIYCKNISGNEDVGRQLSVASLSDKLKSFIAEKLSCNDIKLKPEEISIRLINVSEDGGMIGDVELEIKAAAFKERVEKQDKICLDIAEYIKSKGQFGEVKVWLVLSELGHSWK